MPNPKCHSCSKTVYPLEAITAIDKTWHKTCFKCASCGMKLTLTAVQPHEATGQIYCIKHYPKPSATVVTDSIVMNSARNAPKVDAAQQTYNKATTEKPSSVGVDIVSEGKKTVPHVAVAQQTYNKATTEKPSSVGVDVVSEGKKTVPHVDVAQQTYNKATTEKPSSVGVDVVSEGKKTVPKVPVADQSYNKATEEYKHSFNVIV